MEISSRTPEGQPNHCPVCDADVVIEPSVLFGDAPCPQCGCLLWFVSTEAATHVFEMESSKTKRDRVIAIMAQLLGVAPEKIPANLTLEDITAVGADSLDTVELVMELEEELDVFP